jgi:hypothetical protein
LRAEPDHSRIPAHLELGTEHVVWHRVEGIADLYMTIRMHRGLDPIS